MNTLQTLWKRGTDFLGSKYAILGGAMSWVSESNLVSSISNAGGFGIIACGSMTPALLNQEIKATQTKTSAPFGVNLITMHPNLDALVDVCIACNISHVVLAGGLPKSNTITKLKSHNIKVMCFAPALIIAKKLIKSGVDAIIIEGMEAGGHIGPVSTSVLVQEILPNISEVPIFVAGGIGRGEAISSFLQMGAAGCQLGTRFVCAHESIAHPNFKRTFIQSHARDAVVSVQVSEEFPVIPVRAIANNATKSFINVQHETITLYKNGLLSKEEAQLKIEHFWAGALRKAVIDGDIDYGSVMAGQSVGMVNQEQSVQTIIEELVQQANNYVS
ncbi:Nitronate monooxygenase [Rickettsiales bacterium Ac37b]|nr:Nitronate monooxygenase [Rickettsiales bacterium Ac37b]